MWALTSSQTQVCRLQGSQTWKESLPPLSQTLQEESEQTEPTEEPPLAKTHRELGLEKGL